MGSIGAETGFQPSEINRPPARHGECSQSKKMRPRAPAHLPSDKLDQDQLEQTDSSFQLISITGECSLLTWAFDLVALDCHYNFNATLPRTQHYCN